VFEKKCGGLEAEVSALQGALLCKVASFMSLSSGGRHGVYFLYEKTVSLLTSVGPV
jgi:hypothetical protein